MTLYNVDVVRIGYGFRTIQVEAMDEQDATNKALEQAGSFEYTEKASDYEVNNVRRTSE